MLIQMPVDTLHFKDIKQFKMSDSSENIFSLNGEKYNISELPPEANQLLSLINEAQNEMSRIETRKALLSLAQQQLIEQLKPLLPKRLPQSKSQNLGIIGNASQEIPTTTTKKPNGYIQSFPEETPKEFRRDC